MTNQLCAQFCFEKGFPYAGTEAGTECSCNRRHGFRAYDEDCKEACWGDLDQPCGGPERLTPYYRKDQVTGPTVNPGVDGWVSIGCYAEGATGRALTQGVNTIPEAQMTVTKCTAACKAAGYILAGVEFGGECYCGKRISNAAKPADSGCDKPCNGNGSEYCGGTGHVNVYDYEMRFPTSPSTPAPTNCPGQPASVADWTSYGCYSEATTRRALDDKSYADEDMTLAACAKFCAGYSYFGVEYARECYCGNKLNAGAMQRSAAECNLICSGSYCDFCGAGGRLSLYHAQGGSGGSGIMTRAVPVLPDGWSTYGCWVDGVGGRILNYQVPDNPNLTLQSCAKACADLGYTVAGAEYFRQCFCGKQIVNGGVRAKSETECNSACDGDKTQNCGGPGRMSIMSLGEPQVLGPLQPIARMGSWAYKGLRAGQRRPEAHLYLAELLRERHDAGRLPRQVRRLWLHGSRARVRQGVLLRRPGQRADGRGQVCRRQGVQRALLGQRVGNLRRRQPADDVLLGG